ncbi:MAG: hypothetical protein EON59_06610 [Alphaproteobacteria bacterium]|nr:MAG: hypothetical protein EON59_06610 [Alphaproteobacteria bacterium]
MPGLQLEKGCGQGCIVSMPPEFSQRFKAIGKHYRLDVARYLADLALNSQTVTYGELAARFGGTARGWGNPLSAIAIRCRDGGYPMLSTLVVNAITRLPSIDAKLYHAFGLVTAEDLMAEQFRCFAFDWRSSVLGPT